MMTKEQAVIWCYRQEAKPEVAIVLTFMFSFVGACYVGGWSILITFVCHAVAWFIWFSVGIFSVMSLFSSTGLTGAALDPVLMGLSAVVYSVPMFVVFERSVNYNKQVREARAVIHELEKSKP